MTSTTTKKKTSLLYYDLFRLLRRTRPRAWKPNGLRRVKSGGGR